MAKVLVKSSPKTGDPTKPKATEEIILTPSRTKAETDLDLRDKLSELAIRGNALGGDDRVAILGYLTSTLGKDKALKLMNHAYIFNSRPDVQKLSPEDKLRSFYAIGSSDPDVMEVIGKAKNLGYGVLPGFRESVSDLNRNIQGATTPAVATTDPTEVRRKVRMQLSR